MIATNKKLTILMILMTWTNLIIAQETNNMDAEKSRACWREKLSSDFMIWKKNPWKPLQSGQFPEQNAQECKTLIFDMAQNEYKSASFVVSNLSDKNIDIKIGQAGDDLPLTIRECYYVKGSAEVKKINDALPLFQSLAIPRQESREIWLTLSTRDLAPKTYHRALSVKSGAGQSKIVGITVRVHPISLPSNPNDLPMRTLVYDYVNNTYLNRGRRALAQEAKADLMSHYVNVACIHPDSLPWPKDKNNIKGSMDFSNLDQVLDFWMTDKKIPYLYFYAGLFESRFGETYMDETWKNNFSTWLLQFCDHLNGKGISHENFCVNFMDETTAQKHQTLLSFVKTVNPRIQTFANLTTTSTREEIENISPNLDIFSPLIYAFLPRSNDLDLIKKKARHFWIYANPLSRYPKIDCPYKWYRLIPWHAYAAKAVGCGFWCYLSGSSEKGYLPWEEDTGKRGFLPQSPRTKKISWNVVYPLNEAPADVCKMENIIPSKRWEAWREGITDIMYFDLLEKEIAKAKASGVSEKAIEQAQNALLDWPKKVLADAAQDRGPSTRLANPSLADEAREEIQNLILTLKLSAKKQANP
ncbi:MAG: hypothetical protein PHV34_04695 [Verrucomicrobiae bacterium]|nr:hypothetical protein [Verrucomicrobiae bacterium]